MRELLRTTDPVELCWAMAVLADAGIEAVVFDQAVAAVEAGILAFPQRVMVRAGDWPRARAALDGAAAALRAGNDP